MDVAALAFLVDELAALRIVDGNKAVVIAAGGNDACLIRGPEYLLNQTFLFLSSNSNSRWRLARLKTSNRAGPSR